MPVREFRQQAVLRRLARSLNLSLPLDFINTPGEVKSNRKIMGQPGKEFDFALARIRRAGFDARFPVASLSEEQFPLRDTMGVADHGRHRQFLRCARDAEQLEPGLVREAVGLMLVNFLCGPD